MHRVPHRSHLLLLGALLMAAACIAQPAAASVVSLAPAACGGTSLLEPGQVEASARGYAYQFVVYLPPCYKQEPERTYPILYLVPGRGGSPWAWFTAGTTDLVDELILTGRIAPFVIVGTENIDSDPYGDAIFNDLIPYIEANFRVAKERTFTAVGGGSLGGVAAYRLALWHPDQFASAGVFGSGLIAGEEEPLRERLTALPDDQHPRVFMNSGEQDPYMLDRARVLEGYLDEAGIETTLVTGAGGHEYAYWLTNFPAYLIWVAQDWAEAQ